MALFDKSGIMVVAVLVAVGAAIGWQADRAAAPALAASASGRNGDHGLALDAQRLQAWADMAQPASRGALAVRCWSDYLLPSAQVQLFDIPAQCLAQAPAQVVGGSITE